MCRWYCPYLHGSRSINKSWARVGSKCICRKAGANGIEDRHTNEMLKNASAAIFAVDVAVKEEERFSHLPTIKTKVSAPLKDAKKIIETALVKAEQTARGEYVEHSRHQEAGFLETVKKRL